MSVANPPNEAKVGASRAVVDTTLLLAIVSSAGYAYSVAYFVGYCNWFRIPWALISVSPAQYFYVVAFELPGAVVAAICLVLTWPLVERLSRARVVAVAPSIIILGVAAVAASVSSYKTLAELEAVVLGVALPAAAAVLAYLVCHRLVAAPVEQFLFLLGPKRLTVFIFALFGFAVSAWSGTWWAAQRTEFDVMTADHRRYVVLQFFGDKIVASPMAADRPNVIGSCVKVFKVDDTAIGNLEFFHLGNLVVKPVVPVGTDPDDPCQ